MEEGPKPFIPKKTESVEKRELYRSLFEKSLDVFENPERDLHEGALEILRNRPDGRVEKLSGLVVVEFDEEGPNLCGIDENGDPTASATLSWSEIGGVWKERFTKTGS